MESKINVKNAFLSDFYFSECFDLCCEPRVIFLLLFIFPLFLFNLVFVLFFFVCISCQWTIDIWSVGSFVVV